MYFIYIIQSIPDKKFYVGITKDVKNRLDYHNKKRVRSTKHRVPFKIVLTEKYISRAATREREIHLKSYSGSKEKMCIIENALKASSSNG